MEENSDARRGSRRLGIDTEPGQEVVDCAVRHARRDADRRAPRHAVHGSGEHDVGRALLREAAVAPGGVDHARARRPRPTRRVVRALRSARRPPGEQHARVWRRSRRRRSNGRRRSHSSPAGGLRRRRTRSPGRRWGARPGCTPFTDGRRAVRVHTGRRRPRATAVRRVAGLDQPAPEVHVREVAAAPEPAPRRVVADDPLLVVTVELVRAAVRGRLQLMPLRDRLTSSSLTSKPPPSVHASHQRWAASYAATGSLTANDCPGGDEKIDSPGSKPERHVRPASSDVENPMFPAPPSSNRPDWKTVTTVEPKAKLSGSTCVSCCALEASVRVARELAAHDLAVGRNIVERPGSNDVAADPAANRVDPTVSTRDEPVVSGAAREPVAARAAVDEIAGPAPVEPVVSHRGRRARRPPPSPSTGRPRRRLGRRRCLQRRSRTVGPEQSAAQGSDDACSTHPMGARRLSSSDCLTRTDPCGAMRSTARRPRPRAIASAARTGLAGHLLSGARATCRRRDPARTRSVQGPVSSSQSEHAGTSIDSCDVTAPPGGLPVTTQYR